MRVFAVALAGLSLLTACGPEYQLVDTQPSTMEVPLAMTRDVVFDGLMVIVHDRGMGIDVIDKDAGLLTLDPVTLSVQELEQYCEFPVIDEEGAPATTFLQYDAERAEDHKGRLTGTLQIDILVKRGAGDSALLSLKTHFTASNGESTYDCNSLGSYEDEFLSLLRTALLTPMGS